MKKLISLKIKKIFFSVSALIAILTNLSSPFLLAQSIYAQEATPSAVTSAEPSPTAEPSADTTQEESPAPSASPSPVATEAPAEIPTSSPSAAILEPTPEQTPSAQPLWQEQEDKSFKTNAKLEADREYSSSQNDKVKIKFNKLPAESGFLTIKEIKLSSEQVSQTNALSDIAYEITSTMTDGTFEYDLTLPLPPQAQNQEIKVKAAETEAELPQASELNEPQEKLADTITIKGLNHFTVFVITTPSPDTTQGVLINEIAPTATLEWVELFNNNTQPVDLTGWTIRNSAGVSFSLSGTIPAAGVVAFDVPAGWLLDIAPETVTLLNSNLLSVDNVTISLTGPGAIVDHYPLASESVGRKTNGIDQWVVFATPTKGTTNLLPNTSGAGSLSEAGPVSATTTFPSWYKDSNGLTLDLIPASDPRGISAPVEAGNPFSSQIGFGAEGFWWSADAIIPTAGGQAILVQALEAAFPNSAQATDGDQAAFARVRIRVDVTDPGTYTVTYPYGQKTYNVTTPGRRAINDTVDIGCFSTPGIFKCSDTGTPNFSTLLNGGIGPFLTWDTYPNDPLLTDPITGRKYVGSALAGDHTVTGSPTGNNFFRISGPNIGGVGVNVVETNLFTVTGRLADATAPVITLFGANSINVNQNATYTDPGATCIDDIEGNCTGAMTVTGLPVNTAVLGPQTITYSFTDSTGNQASVSRTVIVVATPVVDITPPVISLNGPAIVNVVAGTAYTEQNATALDDTDGNISASIVVTSTVPAGTLTFGTGPFTVTYNVSDAAGNAATPVVRTVNVAADTTPPTITLNGNATMNILVGANFTDPGATALDNGVDISANIVTSGTVNAAVAGTYTLTYTVTDAAGNTATATRTVIVANTLPAGLVEVGPLSLTTTFPTWFKDSNGLALELMEAADPNGISAPVEAGNPFSSQIGFGEEGFWFSADAALTTASGNALLVQAVEASFAPATVATDGLQSAFTRIRIRVDVPEVGTYTVTYPYGQKTYNITAVGPGFEINDTSDIGCFSQPGLVCTQAGYNTVLSGEVGPFLTWDTFPNDPLLTNPVTGRKYVGVAGIDHTIKGSPAGNNFFRISGPNIGGVGVNVVETNLFTVTGRLADVTPPVITLTGANPFPVAAGSAYVEPGATCLDNIDGNCTASIILSSNVPAGNLASGTGPFTVTYTATDRSGNTATVTRDVTVGAVFAPVLTSVAVTPANPAVSAGGTVQLSANPLDQNNVPFAGAAITYSSADPNIVTVSAGGLLTGVLAGGPVNVTVTATSGATSVSQIVPVTVSLGPVIPVLTSITVTPSAVTLNIGQTQQLTVSPLDQNNIAFAGATISYSSSSAAATVDNAGLVTAVSAGSSTITVTATSGATSVTTVSVITVNTPAPVVTTINITPANPTITGTTQTFTAPAVDQFGNPIVATPTFASTNPGVGTINPTTGVFTATGAGTTVVTATAETVASSTIITIQPVATTATISPAAPTVGVGADVPFSATVADQFGATSQTPVTFGSSNLVVGIINPTTGVFTPLSAGTTTITAGTAGGVIASTVVTVDANPQNGTLFKVDVAAPTNITSVGGSTIQLTANPLDQNNALVAGATTTFESKNTAVATVSSVGLVTPVNAGKATIRVISTNGTTTVKGDFNVTVELPVESANLGSLVTNQVFIPAVGATPNATTTVTVAQPLAINVAGAGGKNHKVRIPAGTVITRIDGAVINADSLSAMVPANGELSGFLTGATINGALQWGIPNVGLAFNTPVTIDINVGTTFDGQTLNISRSTSGNNSWTTDGIVPPATCLVTAGMCTFQITKASFFASYTVAQTSTSSSSSNNNSNSSSGGSSTQAPSCNDAYAGSAPKLLSAKATGQNEVTLIWEKAKDPVTHYVVSYGLEAGKPLFGNPNVGGKETTSAVIKNLSGGTAYFFRVRAGNGCNAGDYSNEISVKATGGAVSGPAEGFTQGVLGAQSDDFGTGTGGPIIEASPNPSASADVLGAQGGNVKTGNSGLPGWVIPVALAALFIGGLSFYISKASRRA